MPTLIIEHNVQDFNTWQAEFQGHEPTRRKYGIDTAHVYRSAADPNRVCVICTADSVEGIRDFMEKSDIEAVMEKAGVVGEPTTRVLVEETQVTN